jgi:peptidyl-prolyl cis-trans isomerase A (cyclophilin A)
MPASMIRRLPRHASRHVLAGAALLGLAACGARPAPLPEAPVASAAPPASSQPPAPLPAPVHHEAAELDPALATATAPELFYVDFATTQGEFVVEVHRAWSPHGADRFYNLVKLGFFDDSRFFRAIPDFMVQFGIPGDPAVAGKWQNQQIPDDPPTQSNLRGFMSFAQTGRPNSRTTQVFICFANHPRLDQSGFTPFGQVIRGMENVDLLYKGYGEGAPGGTGPAQDRIEAEGNGYLDKEFPKLDHILYAKIVDH